MKRGRRWEMSDLTERIVPPTRKVVSALLETDKAFWLTASYWWCTLICGHVVYTSNNRHEHPIRVRCRECIR